MTNTVIDDPFTSQAPLFIRQNLLVWPEKAKWISVIIFPFIALMRTIGPYELRFQFLSLRKYVNVPTGDISSFVRRHWMAFQIKISMNAPQLSCGGRSVKAHPCLAHSCKIHRFICFGEDVRVLTKPARERGFVRFRKGFRCRTGTVDKLLRKTRR